MELINHSIRRALPKLGDIENIALHDKRVICRFYIPTYYWSYFVFEGEPLDIRLSTDNNCNVDMRLYGMAHKGHKQLSYFKLSDLYNLQQRNITVLRDYRIMYDPYGEVGRLGQRVVNNLLGKPDTSLPLIGYHQYNVDKVKQIAQSWCETWIAIAEYHPGIHYLTHTTKNSFYHCGNTAHLQKKLTKSSFSCGNALTLGDLCFIKTDTHLDRYLMIKENLAFDIWPLETLARFDIFTNNIEKMQNYTNIQCMAIGHSYEQPLGHSLIWR